MCVCVCDLFLLLSSLSISSAIMCFNSPTQKTDATLAFCSVVCNVLRRDIDRPPVASLSKVAFSAVSIDSVFQTALMRYGIFPHTCVRMYCPECSIAVAWTLYEDRKKFR